MVRIFLAALGLFSVVAAQAQQRAERAQLDTVSVHLFLTKSGALSPDVETIEGFGAWNFSLQGKDIDGERFYSMLIKVRLTAPREVFAKGPQAEVIVTDRRTRKVVKRERISDVYIGANGWTILPVWIADGACGPFEIVVTGGGKRIAKTLEAACGE
jgi:hypothetical protein